MQIRSLIFQCGRLLLQAPACCFAGLSVVQADVRLPDIINSRSVLQRDRPLRVWGAADPREAITVSFAGQTRSTHADTDGRWQVILDPVSYDATAPRRNMIITGRNRITLEDIVVGDVWLWAGE